MSDDLLERLGRGCNCGRCKLDLCCCAATEEAKAEIEKLREEVQQVVTGRFIAAENAIEAAAAEERAKVVAWLRTAPHIAHCFVAADAIEAKEHLK